MLSVGALIMRPHPDGAVGSLARTARGGLAARTTPADRWASIIFVVCSLIILVVVPVSVAVQVRAMRHGLSEVDYPALAALNRLTVAVADESLAARATPGDAVPADSAAEQEQGALATLDALAPRLRGETAARYDRLRAIVGAWNRERLADLRWGAGGSSTDPHGIADPTSSRWGPKAARRVSDRPACRVRPILARPDQWRAAPHPADGAPERLAPDRSRPSRTGINGRGIRD